MISSFRTISVTTTVFLAIHLSSWADSQQILKNVSESVFAIKVNNQPIGTGFVLKEDTLATNSHVYINSIRKGSFFPTIENTKGEKWILEGVKGISFLADLTLFKIKNYQGPSLVLEDSIEEAQLSNKFFLVGFPEGRFRIIHLVKDKSDTDRIFQEFFKIHMERYSGASGSPIVNEKGRVVAVLEGSGSKASGTRKEILKDLINETRDQEIISNSEAILGWVQQEYENFKILAIQGDDVEAQYQLGFMSLNGDTEETKMLWRRSAEKGHVKALFGLGHIYYHEGNTKQAEKLWKQAAEQGYLEAQYKLGEIQFNKGNMKQAEAYLREAAKQRHPEALYYLGVIISDRGNMKQAEKLWKQAAEQGHQVALFALGDIYSQEANAQSSSCRNTIQNWL